MEEDYKRINDILMKYWENIRGERKVPFESSIDPIHLDDVWDDCFLIQITKTHGYRYDYLGKNLIEAYGENMVGYEVDSLVSTSSELAIEEIQEVLELHKPVCVMGEFENSQHIKIKYRQLLLPFADYNGEVNHILGGMRWIAI